jgi:hypothetical protein
LPWFKVDDGFWAHPKVLELSSQAVALWVRAGSYAAQHLTGGAVSPAVVRMLGYQDADAHQLVEAGLWDGKQDGKFTFHDWEVYQPSSVASKEKRDELSRKRADAGRRGAEARWSQDDGKPHGKLLSPADGNEMPPSRPVPSPSKERTSPAVTESDFETAWQYWPKKVERKKSLEQFKRAAKTRGRELLISDVTRFGQAYEATTARQFVPALNVWLSRERWDDELPTAGDDPRLVQKPTARPPKSNECDHRFVEGWCMWCSERET